MRWLAAVAVLCGCNDLFGLKATQPADAVIAPSCDTLFVGPITFPGMDSATTGLSLNEPAVTPDASELWFVSRGPTGTDSQDLYRATPVGSGYGNAAAIAYLDTPQDDADPAFTGDGLDLVFISARLGGSATAWEAFRAKTTDPFGGLHEIAELAGTGMANGLDLSFDGLAIYYAMPTGDIVRVTRRDRGSPFGAPTTVATGAGVHPAVSPDELELYFEPSSFGSIHRWQRATAIDAFDPMTDLTIIGNARSPRVAASSKVLLFAAATENALQYATRTCP